ncbi:MAG: VWA domain-containing protein [Gemmatimonadota bacterium]
MEFARPWALILLPLCLVPLLWRRRRAALRFSSFLVLPPDRISRSLGLAERFLGAGFVAATVLGLSEPRTPPKTTVRWTEGARLVFVLDQSASMLSPWSGGGGEGAKKLTVAKAAISGFVDRRAGDQMALIGFGKSSIVYTPPISDPGRFQQTLSLLNTDLGDTVIDAALLRALRLLEGQESRAASQVVILLSDGAGRLREPERIAARLRAADVTLYWLLIEGGRAPEASMHLLMETLGSLGETFVVGKENELPRALEEIGRLENRLMKVEQRQEGRSWSRLSRTAALGCLIALGFFALSERARRSETHA